MPATRTRNADPERATLRPDQDRLNDVCMNLAARGYHPLEVQRPDPTNGTVRIVAREQQGRSWTVSVQGRVAAETRSKWNNGSNRS
jgi:hypothetical protein